MKSRGLFLLSVFWLGCYATSPKNGTRQTDCSIMKSGRFISPGMGTKSNIIIIKKNSHIENDYSGKYTTKSNITWLSDCSYKLKILETNYTDRPFKPNDEMIVSIEKVEGNFIYFKAQYKEFTIKDTLQKID